jgi:signal peptidase I
MADAVRVAVHQESKTKQGATFLEYAESLLVTVILALFGTSFIVQAFKIPSPSMEPTLLVGDHLLVNKFIFGGRDGPLDSILPYRPIRRGDIIVFKFPFADHTHYVKRVIGLPGDHLRIVDQQVLVNGRPLAEPYKVHVPGLSDPYGDNFPPTTVYIPAGAALQPEWRQEILHHVKDEELVVPPGKYFVMGDNRDRSWDSRYWGFVDREAVMGRPMVVYWSIDSTTEEYADRTLFGRLAGLWKTLLNFPAKTRWSRMLRTVH